MRIWWAVLIGIGTAGMSWGLNQGPPVGAILDLNGTPVPGGGDGVTFQHYTVNFTAAVTNTTITFAFRDDPAEVFVENFSVVDLAAPGTNLLTNGNLSGGTTTSNGNAGTPAGWSYANIYGATDGGELSTSCPGTTNFCWDDAAVGAYDAISQSISTTIGHTYQVSFYLADDSDCGCNFTRVSAGGGAFSGLDALVYAQAGLPAPAGSTPATPIPNTLLLLITGLAALSAWTVRDRLRQCFFRIR